MKLLPAIVLLLGLSCAAYAQQPATEPAPEPIAETPAPTVEELAAEIEALKAKTSTWDKIVKHLPKFMVYMQPGYEYTDQTSTFFMKRLGLMLTGDIIPKLDYCAHVDFVNPRIIDAFLRYRPFDEFGVQAGQFLIPFSIESTEYNPLKMELIEYPLALRRLMGIADISGLTASGRDTGLQAFGGFFKRDGYSILNYNVGVFNGEGLRPRDVNKSKDVAARLIIKPVDGLQISGSYYWGEYGIDYLRRTRYSVGACYDKGPIVVRSEFTGGTTGRMDSEGVYALAGWRVIKSLMPVVRYDTFLEDKSRSASRQTNYTAGLLWTPWRYLRCQVNYTYEDFAFHEIPNRNVFVLMFTGMFW